MADDFEAVVLADERRRRSTPVIDAIEVLRARQQLALAFAPEHKESR